LTRGSIVKKEEDLATMTLGDLLSKLRSLEQKYKMPYEQFKRSFKDEEATFEELVDQFDWETYWEEFQRRSSLTHKLVLKASSIEDYQPILTPLRMKVYSTLVNSGEATASQVAKKLQRPLPSVVNALKTLMRFGIVRSELTGQRRKYRALAKEIVIKA